MYNYIILTSIVLISLLILYLKKTYSYWTSRGVFQFEPIWLLGNIKPVVTGKTSFGELFADYYKKLKSKGKRFGGAYVVTTPVLVVTDLDLVKKICITDFQHFNSHAQYYHEEIDPLMGHLFNLEGPQWKRMRTKLTPTFTSGKMKMMFHTIQGCTGGFKDMLNDAIKNKEAVDIKDILGRFTTDVIGRCAFGIECNSIKDPNTKFRQAGKKIFDLTATSNIKMFIFMSLPSFLRQYFKIKMVPNDVEKFFMGIVSDTVKYREDNDVVRKDFMHLMIQLKNKGKVTDDDDLKSRNAVDEDSKLNMDEIAAQSFVFFLAGFETSSTTMTFALYNLAQNQDIQDRVRNEINTICDKHDGQVTYDAVMEMNYLDRVVNETLRKHPPVPALPRACTKDYTIPGTNITIKKGTAVSIPLHGIQLDPEYFPDPQKFDPDRFTEENKAKIPAMAFIPFGEGPRICIGLRFGVLQAKIGLISLLRKYRFTLNEKTKMPIELDPGSLINSVKGGVWVNVHNV